jgi:plastocyanin
MTISRQLAVFKSDQIARIVRQVGFWMVMMSSATTLYGQEVDVFVYDRDGQQVADVAVYAVRLEGITALPKPDSSAVMDQIDRQFVPHVLVVQTGTSVDFPNSDTVAHHVYSFSHPNKFVLPMYKGEQHPPVTFEHSGVVSLGCNIHDHMLGYILVVDSRVFGKTNEGGYVSLSLENPEEYSINIWSPRIRDKAESLSRKVTVSDASKTAVTFSLVKKLNPPHGSRSESTSWSEY